MFVCFFKKNECNIFEEELIIELGGLTDEESTLE